MARSRRGWVAAAAVAVGVAVLAALVLISPPFVYAELMGRLLPHTVVGRAAARLTRGRMADDYWAVERISPDTFAIGEPRYYQKNYAYLLLGTRRALLFDSGSGTRDIRPIVARLTRLPVTVMASHLHYDHLGGIAGFRSIAMIDLPSTRADVRDGWFEPGRYEFLGMVDHLRTPRFRVTAWVRPGSWIDLGGRRVRLLATPGHTPSSASLYDPAARQLFAGDYIYPSSLYVQLPGASRSACRATASRLLSGLPKDTVIWSAHCCRVGEGDRAPWLGVRNLAALHASLDRTAAGRSPGSGVYPRRFAVDDQMTLLTGFPWTNR